MGYIYLYSIFSTQQKYLFHAFKGAYFCLKKMNKKKSMPVYQQTLNCQDLPNNSHWNNNTMQLTDFKLLVICKTMHG